jgi:predicted enzyme related to lactoylglutathione lyase
MVGLVLYCVDPRHLVAFYSSLFHFDEEIREKNSISLVGPDVELHFVEANAGCPPALEVDDVPAPREGTPLKFSLQVPSVAEVAAQCVARGGFVRGEAWSWRSRSHVDLVDPEGNIFQVFEETVTS